MKRLKKIFLETKENWQEVLGIIIGFTAIFNIASGLWYVRLLAWAALIFGMILIKKSYRR